jgi:hypothetical protein
MVNEAILDRRPDQTDDSAMTGPQDVAANANISGDLHAQVDHARALDERGRHDEALALLRRAADAGNAPAALLLGVRLFTGRAAPKAPAEGVRFIAAAAAGGDAEAIGYMAAFAAEGRYVPQDWAAAFDHLQDGAERGDERCRTQLAHLTSDAAARAAIGAGAQDDGVWARARAGIDLGALLPTPSAKELSKAPRIRIFENFLSDDLCDWMVEQAHDKLTVAPIYDDASGGPLSSERRSNTNCVFHPIEGDVIQALVRARIAAVAGPSPACMEPLTVLHYEVGQEFRRHVDFLDPALPGLADDLALNGQRIATFLIYLNDGFEGAETEFPVMALRWKGRKGDAILFYNVEPSGAVDRRTMHAGRPPTQGEKWLLSQFIREKPQPL